VSRTGVRSWENASPIAIAIPSGARSSADAGVLISARDALDKALDKEAFARLPAIARALGPDAALTP
jgi:hypothetical protein